MAYTAPPTFSSGAVLTAAQAQILSDDITYLYGKIITATPWHGVKATRGTNLSVADTSRTLVTLPTSEDFDTDAFHDNAVNSSRITLPTGLITAGLSAACIMFGYIEWASNSTGCRELRILRNGSMRSESTVPAVTVSMGQQIGLTDSGSGGDYFEMDAWQNSGGSLNLTLAALSLFVIGIQ